MSAKLRRFPFVNLGIVAACTLAYAAVVYLLRFSDATQSRIDDTLDHYALIPARVLALAERGELFSADFYVPLLSSPFLHVNVLHFLPNMMLLWLVGDVVEDRFGHVRYAVLYLLGALFASLAHVAANPHSTVPTLGASGGIAAVMGAYLLLHPLGWIDFRIAPLRWPRLPLPALPLLLAWLALQVMAGILHHPDVSDPRVAWWAHLGGFTFGAAAVIALGRPRERARAR
jgi:membrane associated rhomboid family serine protease